MKRCHWAVSRYQPAAVLGILCVLSLNSNIASWADESSSKDAKVKDAGTSKNKAATKDSSDSASSPTGKKHARHADGEDHHGHHGPIPPKRQILSLSSLTDEQKQQINAVYSENLEQFRALGKQMFELRMAEWKKIQPILTPDQLSQLGVTGKTGGKAGNGSSEADSSANGGDKASSK